MKNLLNRLQKAIIPQYQYSLHPKEQAGGEFILREDDPRTSCSEAKLKRNDKDILIYKFDQTVTDKDGIKIIEPFLFLSKGKERAKCDYLIFYPFYKGNESKLGAIRFYLVK